MGFRGKENKLPSKGHIHVTQVDIDNDNAPLHSIEGFDMAGNVEML